MPSALSKERPFANAVREYCILIEQMDRFDRFQWLARIGTRLLGLEATIKDLPEPESTSRPRPALIDLDQRFELYFRLKVFLGDQDEYWSEADLRAADGYKTGSLSDDFSDIYFELKYGLMLYEQGGIATSHAVSAWLSSYGEHWRQHLIDARKQLIDFELGKKRLSAPLNPHR